MVALFLKVSMVIHHFCEFVCVSVCVCVCVCVCVHACIVHTHVHLCLTSSMYVMMSYSKTQEISCQKIRPVQCILITYPRVAKPTVGRHKGFSSTSPQPKQDESIVIEYEKTCKSMYEQLHVAGPSTKQ